MATLFSIFRGPTAVSLFLLLPIFMSTACTRAMRDDSRLKPLEEVDGFANGSSAFLPPAGTVARGHAYTNTAVWTGKVKTNFISTIPMEVNRAMLERGQERYEIYCAPCHDSTGSGHGMIVQRGLKQPLPFTDDKLRNAPAGYLFDTITHGYQTMLPMAAQVPMEDRWAIVAYMRVLQRSEHASLADVPPEQRKELEGTR